MNATGSPCPAADVVDQLETIDWPAVFPEHVGDNAHYRRLASHHPPWLSAVADGLRHRIYLLQTTRNAAASGGPQVSGILPLALVRGPLFGRFLVSLPYINSGGVWARDAASAYTLISGACDLADRLQVRYLELRHELAVDHPRLNHQRTDKLHLRLPLPPSEAQLDKSFKSKLRSQIKKAGEFGLEPCWGRHELLAEFYNVFSRNMRDLGTPVFSRRLFIAILDQFPQQAELCVVRHRGVAIAAALLVHLDGVTEVPSASSLRQFNHTGANMLMYRHLLGRAIARRSHTFDFGRSSEGSGTYRFKTQWGAQPHPAHWQYYVRQGRVEAMRPEAQGNQRLIRIWQRLPVWFTRLVGPEIVRGIP